ncbi:MAG: hypothetical protein HY925_04660 [Elusimicrobia bacterium]|nr:hypothetical protein [Elusimicrobiota bacterium]
MKAPTVKTLFMAALGGLLCGVVGETLLFLEAQTRRVENVLADDFRIVVFLAGEQPESQRNVLEDKLQALPGTAEVRYVSRDAALDTLRREDPELMKSIALLGENPLQSAFEARLDPESIARASQWADAAAKFPGVGDIRFKPMEVQAVVQCQFFVRFLRLAISLSAFFWLAGAAAGLWAAMKLKEARGVVEGLPPRLGLAAAGTAGGMGLVLIAALPLKTAPAGWAAPAAWAQFCLFIAGVLGALLAWDWSGAYRFAVGDERRHHELAAHSRG